MTDTSAAAPREDVAAARLVRRVLAQWPLVIVCALVAGVAAYALSARKPNTYQSTTVIQLNDIDLASVFLAQNLQQLGLDASVKAATAAKLASTPAVLTAAAESLGGKETRKTLAASISVTPQADTTLIDITATAPNPDLAARRANAVRLAYIKNRQQLTSGQLENARARVGQQIRDLPKSQLETQVGINLTSRYNQLDTLIATQGSGVNTAQEAVPPTDPVGPRPKRAAILGIFLGGLLGLAIALLRARLDDRVRDQEELSEHWGLPVLGLIPQSDDLAKAGTALPSPTAVEAFALARTNMRYLHVGGHVKTVIVTSAMEGEGKSTVAWNLAVAAAMAGQRVLLVDADLRRPVIASRVGLTSQRGLSDLLAGLAKADEVVSEVRVQARGADDVVVDVVGAGFVPPSPIALLERASTGDALASLSAPYELVIIDTPPATVVADAKVLLGHADGAIVVSRLGKVTGKAIDRLRDILAGLDKPVLGTIINAGSTGKAYGYASYESTPTQPVAPTPGSGEDADKPAKQPASASA